METPMVQKGNSSIDTSSILKSVPDLYLILNPSMEIVEVSNAYLQATMVTREQILGRLIFDAFPDNPDDKMANGVKNLRASLEKVLNQKVPDTMAIQKYDIRRPIEEGGEFEIRYWSPINVPVFDEKNHVIYLIHRVEDVTELVKLKKMGIKQQRLAEKLRTHVGAMESEIMLRTQELQEMNKQLRVSNEELEYLAYFDTLTGLANRQQLYHRIQQCIGLARNSDHKVGILFLNLDKFKGINDSLGHKMGDLLLQIVAKRLSDLIKINDLVARLGSDEFVILINKINDANDLEKIARRILQKFKTPFVIEKHTLFVSVSIGISYFPENGEDENTLLMHANIAMNNAKQTGRNNHQFCTPEMVMMVQKKIYIENEIRHALQKQKFMLHYQPQIDLRNGRISGVEALLRLERSKGRFEFSQDFIAVAEETGLIISIGEWMLYSACEQYIRWEKTVLQGSSVLSPIRLSIRFSARQINEPGFLEMVQTTFRKTKFLPLNLELEINEYPPASEENSTKIIHSLKTMGVNIVLYDFGARHASLNSLRDFSIDKLKINRSLLDNIPYDKTDTEIVKTIIRMAHTMEIKVVAEDIKNEEQLRFLIENQCDIAQSNYFKAPLPAEQMTSMLKESPSFPMEKQVRAKSN